MTPGTYIRLRREADGLSPDDLALMLDSVPAISHRSRVELLATIEADTLPVSLANALVLSTVLSIDLNVLGQLVEARAGRPAEAPRICRACACSDDNACPGSCAWPAPDLCTACAPIAPVLLYQGGEAAA